MYNIRRLFLTNDCQKFYPTLFVVAIFQEKSHKGNSHPRSSVQMSTKPFNKMMMYHLIGKGQLDDFPKTAAQITNTNVEIQLWPSEPSYINYNRTLITIQQ